MTQHQRTTGQTVSRLGVLAALAFNFIEENHLDEEKREQTILEINRIVDGRDGISARQIAERSFERCMAGAWN